jgi:hypothetical protein
MKRLRDSPAEITETLPVAILDEKKSWSSKYRRLSQKHKRHTPAAMLGPRIGSENGLT